MIRYIRRSFKRELLLSFLVTAVIPLILTSVFLIGLFQGKLKADDAREASSRTEAVGAAFQEQFEKFQHAAGQLCTDEELLSLMKKQESLDTNGIYVRLYVLTEEMREEAQFDIYGSDGTCVCSTGAGLRHERLLPYWGVLRTAAAQPEKLAVQREAEGESGFLLRAAQAIRDKEGDVLGYAVISIKKAHFDGILEGISGSTEGICILDRYWEPIYSIGNGTEAEIAKVLRYQLLAGEQLSSSYRNNNVSVTAIGDTGLFAVCLLPKTMAEGATRTMYRVMLAMTLVSMGLCVAMAFAMSGNLTKPVRLLVEAMQQVREGRMDTRVELDREDELGLLARHFNAMTVELSEHIKRQVRQQRELNETSIAMMQSQLNPHFLYNTLDTMKWSAKANGASEVAMMATKLAKILRTSISGEPFITLREELALVDSYVRIQEIRISGRFFYETDVPEELLACMVPKLTIQPLVENALLHGLEGKEDGHIRVTARRAEETLCIEVQDDGCGIGPEKLEELNDRERKGERKPKGHIGFYNVDTILRLNYGEAYGLHVSRAEEGGTLVTIKLPVRMNEKRSETVC